MAKFIALVATIAVLFSLTTVRARDPELLTDFAIPEGVGESELNGTFFTYTGLRGGAPAPPGGVGAKPVKLHDFPALNGMGVSIELVEYAPGAVNLPHTHPRGSEILYVMEGSLSVGTFDGKGKVYENKLQKGDVFLFPAAMPHYQANFDLYNKAVVLMSFGSADAGYINLADLLGSTSSTANEILSKSFKVSA